MVNSKPVTKDEFLRQFSVDFPDVIDESINLQYHLEYRVDSQGHSILTELESGFISYRNAANNRNVYVYVSKDKYIITKSLGFGSTAPTDSKINSKDVRIVEYNRLYGGQYKTGPLITHLKLPGEVNKRQFPR